MHIAQGRKADAGQAEPCSEMLHHGRRRAYVISNRRRNRVKVLDWDRNGFWLLLKRLERDRFTWPATDAVPTPTAEQSHWLLEGIDAASCSGIRSACTKAWRKAPLLHGLVAPGRHRYGLMRGSRDHPQAR